MKIALNEAGILVIATNAHSNQNYYCPRCQKPVRLVIRKVVNYEPYFKHQPDKIKQTGETKLHEEGKAWLAAVYQKAGYQPQNEVYLPQLKQRPDLLIHGQQSYVALEYQCSPLSEQRYQERRKGYTTLGLPNFWLLGPRYYPKKQLHQETRKYIQWTAKAGCHLYFLIKKQNYCIEHWQNLVMVSSQARIFADRYQYRFHDQHFNLVAKQQLPSPMQVLQYELKKLASTFYYEQPQIKRLKVCCYEAGYQLAGFPLVCHELAPFMPVLHEPIWAINVKVLLYISKLKQFSLAVYKVYYQQVAGNVPQYGEEQVDQLAMRFLKRLLKTGNLVNKAHDYYWSKLPTWYQDIKQKEQILANKKAISKDCL